MGTITNWIKWSSLVNVIRSLIDSRKLAYFYNSNHVNFYLL